MRKARPRLDESYKSDFLLLTTESLIRAIEARLDRKPAAVRDSLMAGYVLTPFFSEALALYEKQETAMRMYFPDMMASMDLKKESKRLDGIDLTVAPQSQSQLRSKQHLSLPAIRRRKRLTRRSVCTKRGILKRPARPFKRRCYRPNESRCTRGFTMD